VGVNTIFQVIHNAGLRTAWSDKHAIYTSFNGPGSNGMSIDDFFGPEIDSQAVEPNGVPYPVDGAWTADNAATKQYDSYKVQAVINWINGYEHSGKGPKVGTPAIYGMNFQTVSTAEKLKSSPAVLIGPNAQGDYAEGPPLPGGYMTVDGQQVPGPLLQSALDYVNDALQRMADTIQADGEAGAILRRLDLRPAPPRRVRDRAGRHDLYDRLEDRRTWRRQPGRPGCSARRLCAGRRPAWPVRPAGGNDPGRPDHLEAAGTQSELASGRPARGNASPTRRRRGNPTSGHVTILATRKCVVVCGHGVLQ